MTGPGSFSDDPVFQAVAPALLRKILRKNATFQLRFSIFEGLLIV